jgi:predicted glycogen debranching enzyme
MPHSFSDRQEWLEADGLGGFASGTVPGLRTRRYHALLLSAATPPTGRQVLVAAVDAEVSLAGRSVALSSHRYLPDVIYPDGTSRLARFTADPWPCWTYHLDDDTIVEHSLFVPAGAPVVVLRWRRTRGTGSARLTVRPFLAGRDYHSLQHANDAFRFEPTTEGTVLGWNPYDGVQPVVSLANGRYRQSPDWYRNFEYAEERARGLDSVEDLACPGAFEWDLADGDAVLLLAARQPDTLALFTSGQALDVADTLARSERRRRGALGGPMDRAADAYLVRRGTGRTIIAGYPWFTDWGRDTFIAIRGLCLATGRYTEAREILVAWSGAVSEGMLPNRFPDAGEAPEFNAVDASLWFVIAAHELLEADPSVPPADRELIRAAMQAILAGYQRGTRFGIHADEDGLLAAGVPGVQLTWMDAKVGDRVITPRIGKPVEVQALWINALWAVAQFDGRWAPALDLATASFERRFWNEQAGALFDVVDANHVPGAVDDAFRPNQILAAGGLPLALLDGPRTRRLVDAVEARLWTPAGLRSLAPDASAYTGRYGGDVASRDGAYHQGTVWPWLAGPFVDAWVRVRGATAGAREEARLRFLEPLLGHFDAETLGHVPEVADGDAPHASGGCPFQAWSLGEALRLRQRLRSTPGEPETGAAVRHPIPAVRR